LKDKQKKNMQMKLQGKQPMIFGDVTTRLKCFDDLLDVTSQQTTNPTTRRYTLRKD
jgi:hypothetical protein